MKIHFITTGGTIDKIYFDEKSEYEIGSPQVAEVLKAANVAFAGRVKGLFEVAGVHAGLEPVVGDEGTDLTQHWILERGGANREGLTRDSVMAIAYRSLSGCEADAKVL